MNVAAVVRRLENGGFNHDQAAILAEVLHEEITDQIATKELSTSLSTAPPNVSGK
jgi:hypothetical protein